MLPSSRHSYSGSKPSAPLFMKFIDPITRPLEPLKDVQLSISNTQHERSIHTLVSECEAALFLDSMQSISPYVAPITLPVELASVICLPIALVVDSGVRVVNKNPSRCHACNCERRYGSSESLSTQRCKMRKEFRGKNCCVMQMHQNGIRGLENGRGP